MTQPYLSFDPPPCAPCDPLEAAALDFHRRHPHVLQALAAVCLRVRRAGRRRWSINAAFEVVRYRADIRGDTRPYKLNNNHRAWYARWLMRDVPMLVGLFVTRDTGADNHGR